MLEDLEKRLQMFFEDDAYEVIQLLKLSYPGRWIGLQSNGWIGGPINWLPRSPLIQISCNYYSVGPFKGSSL